MDLEASTILQYLSYGKSELLASMENFFFLNGAKTGTIWEAKIGLTKLY